MEIGMSERRHRYRRPTKAAAPRSEQGAGTKSKSEPHTSRKDKSEHRQPSTTPRFTTRLQSFVNPALSALPGCAELHGATIVPAGDTGGPRTCVTLSIPENANRVELAAKCARATQARVLIIGDTRGQVERTVRRMMRLLPDHKRMALERSSRGKYRTDA